MERTKEEIIKNLQNAKKHLQECQKQLANARTQLAAARREALAKLTTEEREPLAMEWWDD